MPNRGSGFQACPLRPMLWVCVYSLRRGFVVHQYSRVTAAAVAHTYPKIMSSRRTRCIGIHGLPRHGVALRNIP